MLPAPYAPRGRATRDPSEAGVQAMCAQARASSIRLSVFQSQRHDEERHRRERATRHSISRKHQNANQERSAQAGQYERV